MNFLNKKIKHNYLINLLHLPLLGARGLPAPLWLPYQRHRKNNIIKEHPDIKQQEIREEIFFAQPVHRFCINDGLCNEPYSKYDQCQLPVIKDTAYQKEWIE